MRATVQIEETFATCDPPNNGAGPWWCYGSPLVVCKGNDVYASVMETGTGVPLLCNTRPRLFRRDRNGWSLAWQPEAYRHREPCPLVGRGDRGIALSVNPSTQPVGTQYGPCDPYLLAFPGGAPPAIELHPPWPRDAVFTDHSYRGAASDAKTGRVLLLNIDAKTSLQHWALLDSRDHWVRLGAIEFPIRAAYPQVALRGKAAFVLAIGDIVEPNEEWRRHKKEKTGANWDYVFRRLFLTWSDDVSSTPFCNPLEVDSVEATAGHITNLDLWIAPNGEAHLLYLRTTSTPLIRDRFLPGTPIRIGLIHAVYRGAKRVRDVVLFESGEGGAGPSAAYARFHTVDGRTPLVIATVDGYPRGGAPRKTVISLPNGDLLELPLREPLAPFFTNCERGGSPPSRALHLLGAGADGKAIRYARIALSS